MKVKCNKYEQIVLPNIKPNISSYKPTYSKNVKSDDYGNVTDNLLKSVVSFVVTADGNVEEVNAVGNNENFNKDVELMIYDVEKKWTVTCQNGFGVRSRYRLPVTLNLK